MDILPQKKTTEAEVTALEAEEKSVAAKAELILKKAQSSENIRKSKDTIKDAKLRIKEAGDGGTLGIGGLKDMSKNTKYIIIIVGTLVLFGLMKLAGC